MYLLRLLLLVTCNYSFCVGLIVVKLVLNESAEHFDDEEASFGPRISDDNPTSGYLFVADPIEGCTHTIPLPINASHHAIPFICLIKRGKCNFDDKVRAAERGGYSGAIIFNHLDDNIFPMGSQSAVPVNIPSFMVGLSDGMKFMERFTNPYENYIFEIYPNHKSGFEIYLIPVLSMLGLFLLGVVCVCIYRWNEQRRRRRRRCLSASQVSRLPLTKFIKGQTQDGSCVICLDDYEDGDKLRSLPCGHVYHSKCIDPWLLKNSRLCPICKRAVFPRSTSSSRRPAFFVYLRSSGRRLTRQNLDGLENRLVSDSESNEEGYDDVAGAYSYPDPEGRAPATSSYGTVVTSTAQSCKLPPEGIPNESTPLLPSVSERIYPSPNMYIPCHSRHSAPSSLDAIGKPLYARDALQSGFTDEQAILQRDTNQSTSLPTTFPSVFRKQSAPDLHASIPVTELQRPTMVVTATDVMIHHYHNPS